MAEDKNAMPQRGKRGLGKGLGALFESEADPGRQDPSQATEIGINQLEPNRDQPRRSFDEASLNELTESIRHQGVIAPLIVTPSETADHYTIVAGERRWRAARRAGLSTVPVVIRHLSREEVQRQALIDNVVREDLNAIEEAQAFNQLMKDFGMTQESLAAALGKSRPAIANTLRLLNLPQAIQDLVRQDQLSPGHARALLALAEAEQQKQAAQTVLADQLSVRDTEKLVQQMNQAPVKPAVRQTAVDSSRDLHLRDLEDKLRRALATRVTLEGSAGQGRIVIRYHNADERERLIEQLLGLGS